MQDGDSRLAISAELTKPGIESSDYRFAPDFRGHVEHAFDLGATVTYTAAPLATLSRLKRVRLAKAATRLRVSVPTLAARPRRSTGSVSWTSCKKMLAS